MGMFEKLKLSDSTDAKVEWKMTPNLAFCTFSAKGLREGLTNTRERLCYFFIDNWGDEPRLYLMERGVRHVNILAEVKAPPELLTASIINQGGTAASRDNFPVDAVLKDWLIAEVIEPDDSPFLLSVLEEVPGVEDMGENLPPAGTGRFAGPVVLLPPENGSLDDEQVRRLIRQWNFYDAEINPDGFFDNQFADAGEALAVVDEKTGLMWQRVGLDLCSIRSMKGRIEQLNLEGFAGYHDWRMPTLEEAMSLMEPAVNAKGVHLHPCFSMEQPFIFVQARRTPTGYWFVDYKQGKAYWSSGTVPGGFSRLCRTWRNP